jgi:pimeloyl-ACP methyl ester carboxylesterase
LGRRRKVNPDAYEAYLKGRFFVNPFTELAPPWRSGEGPDELTPAQGERLWEAAAAVRPGGTIAEIGSYRGKSAIVMASAAADGVMVTAIDPHAGNDRGPQQIHGTADEIVPIELSRSYSGGRLIEIPGGDHFDVIDPQTEAFREVVLPVATAIARLCRPSSRT